MEATREKEVKAILKFERDSNWPLSITAASAVEEFTSLSVTYQAGWGGCDSSLAWCWTKFGEAAIADGLTQPPAFQREWAKWDIPVRKENNSVRVLLRGKTKDGVRVSRPEEPGPPCMVLYAPRAVVKFRSTASDVIQTIVNCVGTLYQGRMNITEVLSSNEWAMVGALGDCSTSGEMPRGHRAMTHPDGLATAYAFFHRVHEVGLKTQNYDKGFEKFVRKCEPTEGMAAVISIALCCREDHGGAVYLTQDLAVAFFLTLLTV
jgi:hypothetical protein